ncbi:centrosomal protein of 68 kDa isoform X1 [Chelonoidis abingdonii]|uniref:centrosomal protein of 68 kDa isoform X1 n=2 Tax=Chelonoidis abingdonii TaxID=106734 RepID=UPI0013F22A5E|nr:centrosomal protein of 68 kDa isoform X1 [Chelonoidis abingdonii]XP_032662424.1 centrosomal protein of 68 kDa isoform X1 [Chelonoidis abingdonii]
MVLDVGKSGSEASLNVKSYGRWNYTELETDSPELVSSVHQLLEAKQVKSSPKGTEDVAMDGTGHRVTGVSQRKPSCCKVSLTPSSRFSRAKAKTTYVERQPLTDCYHEWFYLPHRFSRTLSHPGGQQCFEQMKMVECPGCKEHLPNAPEHQPTLQSSAMDANVYISSSESLSALNADRGSQASLSLSSTTSKALPNRTLPSFDTVIPTFSRSSLSTPPSEDDEFEQQEIRSRSLPARRVFPSSEVFPSRYLHSRSTPVGDPVLSTCRPLNPLFDDCVAVEQGKKGSSFQADYWACAIPDSLPPSPDRQSPHWNPNKEYEDLLDYTYPLKPKYKLAKNIKFVMPDPFFHDSGIDLDSFSVSPESTLKGISAPGQNQHVSGNNVSQSKECGISAERFSTPLSKKPGYLGAVPYCGPSPITKVSFAECVATATKADPVRGFANSFLTSKYAGLSSCDPTHVDGRGWGSRGDEDFSKCQVKKNGASHFVPTTQILPLKKAWENDEEFLSLPPRIKELEGLARYLSDLSLTKGRLGHDQVQQDLPCYSGSRSHLLSELVEDQGSIKNKYGIQGSEDCVLCHACSSQKPSTENINLSSQDHRESVSRLGMPSIRDMLDGRYLGALESEGQDLTKGKDQQKESLVQCIKIFCCQLEELIHWLYKVAEVIDNWIPPEPDVESVKTSLHRYLQFKKDVTDHQTLTESVLRRGETLLKCMASNSPVLKDTLGLIAKQSEELESHAERLYESVLAATHTIGGDSLIKDNDTQQTIAQAKEAKWVIPLAEMEFVSQSLEA